MIVERASFDRALRLVGSPFYVTPIFSKRSLQLYVATCGKRVAKKTNIRTTYLSFFCEWPYERHRAA